MNDPTYWNTHKSYEYFHSDSAKEVNSLAKFVKKQLPNIKTHILIVHSLNDKLVDVSNAKKIFQNVSSEKKFLLLVNRTSHVLTKDYDWEFIFNSILNFINEVSNR